MIIILIIILIIIFIIIINCGYNNLIVNKKEPYPLHGIII